MSQVFRLGFEYDNIYLTTTSEIESMPMCGRYDFIEPSMIPFRFDADLELTEPVKPRYNVAPTQQAPIIVRNSPNKAIDARFGLVTVWAKNPSTTYSLINARAETVAIKPTYKKLLESSRCLVPVTGYFEWQSATGKKVPHHFTVIDTDIFALAGLYNTYTDEQGKVQHSFVIITTTPNELASKVHDRMPVILHKDDEMKWLDMTNEPSSVKSLLKPFPSDRMESKIVSTYVNNPKHDDPKVLESAHEK